MKNSLRIHKWTHNEFNIFILGVLTHPPYYFISIIVNCIYAKLIDCVIFGKSKLIY